MAMAPTASASDHTPAVASARTGWTAWLFRRLQRETTSGAFIPEIDGLRFFLLSLVVFQHLSGNIAVGNTPGPTGWAGVLFNQGGKGLLMFFAISGFLLAIPFATHRLKGGRPVRLSSYFARRLTRIEPPYIIAMTGIFLMAMLATSVGASALSTHHYTLPVLSLHYLVSLFYLHGIVFGTQSPINPVAWSLEIEVQFYILVPALAAIFLIRQKWARRSVIAACGMASVLLQYTFIGPTTPLGFSLVSFLQYFLVGFLLADIYLLDWDSRRDHRLIWDVISVVAWISLFVVWGTWHPNHSGTSLLLNLAFPVLSFTLLFASFHGRFVNGILRNRWVTTMGGMCYSIYLVHLPVILLSRRLLTHVHIGQGYWLNFALRAPFVLAAIAVVATLFFVLIERPCMDRRWPAKLTAWARTKLAGAAEVAGTVLPGDEPILAAVTGDRERARP